MKNRFLVIPTILLPLLLAGCLPDDPETAKQKAEEATAQAKESLTTVGEATGRGIEGSKKVLHGIGGTAKDTLDTVTTGLTALGETVSSLGAPSDAASPPADGASQPISFEREPGG